MLLTIGWLLLGGILLNKGYTVLGTIVLVGLVVAFILAGISLKHDNEEKDRARANHRYYWAHYYDKDQVEARKRMKAPEPVPELEDDDDWLLIASALDDD